MFLAHFSGTTVSWQKSFANKTSAQELAGFGRGPTGELLLAGSFTQALDLGGTRLRSMGDWSIFRATFDANGGFVADQSFDAMGTFPSVTGVAADAAGSTLVTGLFDGTLAFETMPLVCQGTVNGYLGKMDAQGQLTFTQVSTEPSTSNDATFCVAADASNNVLWGAHMLFLNQGVDTRQGRITKLDPSGATLWSVAGTNFGPRAFAFDAGANVIAVGDFSSSLDIVKGGPILATNGSNAFIAKFAP
jgi:hypothetical protein